MADQTTAAGQRPLAAPYTAFQSIKTVIGTHREHGVPSRIDRTMLRNFSGAVGSQVLTALRFLRLIDDWGHPQPAYPQLVDAYGTDAWKDALSMVLAEAYAPLFEHDLTKASPGEFSERFRLAYPSEGETLRKGITFFLNAARDAGIPISPYITAGMKQRTPSVGVRRRAPRANSGRGSHATAPQQDNGADTAQHHTSHGALNHDHADLRSQLVGKFPAFNPEWDDAIKAEWFRGFQQLMNVVEKPRTRGAKSASV